MAFADTCQRVMDGAYDGATADEKRVAVRDIIVLASAASAAIALQPIPAVDAALLAPVQMVMVQAIARVHGYAVDRKSILELLSTFGASIATRAVFMAAAKLVPFAGWAMAASMAYALTYAMGEASDHYYRNGRGVAGGELRDVFRASYERTRAEKQARAQGDGTLKERLERLQEAYAAGLVNEEEYRAKKEEMLKAL